MPMYDERIAKRKAQRNQEQKNVSGSVSGSMYDERIAKRKEERNAAEALARTDPNQWVKEVNSVFKGINGVSNLREDEENYWAKTYTSRLEQLRETGKRYRSIYTDPQAVAQIDDIIDSISQGMDYLKNTGWSRRKTQEEQERDAGYAAYDFTAGQKELDDLNAELKRLRDEKNVRDAGEIGRPYAVGQTEAEDAQYTTGYGIVNSRPYAAGLQVQRQNNTTEDPIRELEEKIAQKQQYFNQAKQYQNIAAYDDTVNEADFDQYDDYIESEDVQYNWINDPQYREEYENRYRESHKLTFPDSPHTIERKSKFTRSGYDRMNAGEIAIYNYYYAKSGKEAAQKYLDTIQERLNKRTAKGMFSTVEDNVAAELVFGVAAGLDQFGNSMKNVFNTKDDYIPQSAYQIASGMVREDLADDGKKFAKILGGSSLGQFAYDAVTTTANMAPSILASYAVAAAAGTLGLSAKAAKTVGSYAGNTAMGLSAAGGAYQQALNEGYDKDQARGYSILVGASEVAMEKLLGGISALGGNALGLKWLKNIANADNALLAIGWRIGGSSLSEFGEEYLQETLEPVFSNIMLKTDKEVNPISSQAFYSGFLGALTGAFMEAPAAIYGGVRTASTGRKLKEVGGVDSLAKIGNTFAADTVAYKLAGKVDENTGAYTIGHLFNEIGATLTEQNVGEITEALVKEGVGETEAKKYAKAFAYVVEGGTLPEGLVNAIEADTVLAKAAREVLIDSNTTWNQRTQGYNETLRKLAMDKVAGKKAATAQADTDRENSAEVDTVAGQNENTPSGAQAVEGRNIHTGTQETVATDADSEEGLIFEAFTEMQELGTDAANEIISIRRKAGGSGQLFANVMQIAYEYGYANLSDAALLANTYHGDIPNGAVLRIYQIGKEARATEDARRAQEKKSIVGGKTEVYRLTETGEVKKLGEGKEALKVLAVNERSSVGVQTAQFLKKIGVGGNYYFIQSYTDTDGKRRFVDRNGNVQDAHNGMYYSNGDIYIDLNAGTDSSGITQFTIAHELAHFIQQWSAEKYRVLADFLAKHYAKNGISAYRAIKMKQQTLSEARGTKVSFEEAYHEFVADSLSTMFADGNIYEILLDLKKTDKSVFDKIRSYINKLAQKAKLYYGGEIAPTMEGQFMQMQSKETIEQLQQMFADALVGASENYRNAETQKNTDQEVGVQYSHGAYSEPITLEDVEILRRAGRKSINAFTSQEIQNAQKWAYKFFDSLKTKSPFFRAWFGEWRENSKVPINHVVSDTSAALKNGRAKNKDTGIEMSWNAHDVVRETGIHAARDKVSKEAINQLAEIVENAVLLDTVVSIPTSKSKIKNTAFMHGFYAVYDTGSAIHVLKLYAEMALNNKGDAVFTRAYQLKDIKKVAVLGGGVLGANAPLSGANTTTINSIADLLDVVKQFDPEYTSNPPSKVVNSDGTPKVMYHGTRAENGLFYEFDSTKAVRKGGLGLKALGNGNYFTARKLDGTERYGSRVVAAYLDIKNPFVYKGGTSFVEQATNALGISSQTSYDDLQAEMRKRGYDGVIQYGSDGEISIAVAFDSNQIKSATDNIGTFDGSNPDIRYSDASSESVSNRTLLANAMESLAKHEVEKKYLSEYKAKIETMNAEEQKLSEIKAQIRELSFAKGPRDKEKLKTLREEARKITNRINIYDKQLLRLEASQALKNILDREKAKAYQRGRAKGEAALERSRENRNKTAMRHKIQNVVKELNSLLLTNDKKRHVPDSLKKPVEEALDLLNMDTADAENRAAKYADLIAKEQAKANPDQDKIDAYTVTMENILRQGEKMGQRIKDLKNAYEEIQKSDDPDIANAYDPVIAGAISELAETIGKTPLKNMTMEQLSDVYDVYRMVLNRVRDANKAMADNIKEAISKLAGDTTREIQTVGGSKKYRASMLDPVSKFDWNNLKPVYAMERIGSSTMTKLFDNVRAGEDVWAKDVSEAREYYLERSKKYGYDKWDFDKKYRFESNSGIPFELTLEQILSLYAYSKREQAADHLRLGGFVFDSNIETYREKDGKKSILKYKVNTADAHQITPEIMTDIIGNLTDEQTGFVDEMQDYLSTVMGAKGNEVTSKMYGVKLFKEKFYFPLISAKEYMFKQNQVAGEVRIKNSGFTNKVVAKANNPVILSNFMDVWSGHVNDMSMYHAFTLPLEDFNRVLNYNSPKRDGVESVSVKGTIQNAYGPAAVEYMSQLIKDLNGGARTDSTTGFINKMMGLFKKGAVFASLSVVVQQPSAIARAAALIDTKYFIGPRVDQKRHKHLWEEVKKYAPVAIIKEMGYFDTNMGKSTQDFITGKEYSGIKEQAKAAVTDSAYRDELLSKAPALADEYAWCGIWAAVKRETKAKYPDMDSTSEAFLKLAGKRFTEVITKTQVYDSVLARSANMRSEDTGMKMATAFMAEPTTSINMIEDAILKGKRGDRKYARTAIGAVIASQALNAILVSFVYAGRDDDEDETYWEKYVGSLTGSLIDGLNPATYIPFIKDIASIMKGYDVERSDMAVVSDLWNAWKNLKNDKVSPYRKVENFAGSIAQIFGLPVKNIMRDVRGIYNTIMNLAGAEKTTVGGMKYAISGAITGKTVSNKDQLYEARLAGDEQHEERVAARYDDEDSANAAVRAAIKDRFMADEIDEATAVKYMVLHAGMDGSEAHWTMDAWKYRKKVGSDDGYGKYAKFHDAVRSGNNLAGVIKEYTDNGVKTSTLTGEITDEFKPVYLDASDSERKSMKAKLINAYVQCGMERDDAQEKLESWDFEAEYGFAYSDRKETYLSGKVSKEKMVDILIDRGYDEESAEAQVEVYEWEDEGFEDVTTSVVRNYNEWCKPAGISKSVYLQFWRFDNSTENDVDKTTGKKIPYSAVKKIMAYINSLNLTKRQKDALAKSAGWSDKTIQKYKLW